MTNIGSAVGFEGRFDFIKKLLLIPVIRIGVTVANTSSFVKKILAIQLIEQIIVREREDIVNILYEREKHWQVRLFLESSVLERKGRMVLRRFVA